MSANSISQPVAFPVLSLLNPREHMRWMIAAWLIGGAIGAFAAWQLAFPKWAVAAVIVAAWLPTAVAKWRSDLRRYGIMLTLLGVLLTTQGLHTVEHVAQWVQYYLFWWTLRESNGLLSPLNAEWVHFVWNWSVLIVMIVLVCGGLRNKFAWILLGITFFHTMEHTYLTIRYVQVLNQLRELGVTDVTAQGLPGFFGRDGWLARSAFTQGTFLCTLPGFTTATRLDVHFWWNAIEMVFLALAGHVHLRKTFRPGLRTYLNRDGIPHRDVVPEN
jgi:hypothetical protein